MPLTYNYILNAAKEKKNLTTSQPLCHHRPLSWICTKYTHYKESEGRSLFSFLTKLCFDEHLLIKCKPRGYMLRQWLERDKWFELNPSLSCLWSDLTKDVPTATQWHSHSFFISWDKTEPRHTLMCPVMYTQTHTYTQWGYLDLHISLIIHNARAKGKYYGF